MQQALGSSEGALLGFYRSIVSSKQAPNKLVLHASEVCQT